MVKKNVVLAHGLVIRKNYHHKHHCTNLDDLHLQTTKDAPGL